ncbi:TonB-linked outer membrane protein, SusC/RagA family [Dyadobacter koreensis]|uniref:TonB-linked outer membrane protein, SusC/RagA family n=1 Tax=Dyadobacter koreensis TaxID=408657 RepID=A0A1H6VSN7_9BACT|nr:SusC/RagA family TonB-linked outer membrane protein [Dyadobacter koreensis]SEJ03212.1 TonB-linked outer membrane protein, SusC/RagA family [Dyadobacter koreensis]
MKHYIYRFCILLLIVCPILVQAQQSSLEGLVIDKNQVTQKAAPLRTLQSQIQELEKQFSVSILYNSKILNGKKIQARKNFSSLEKALEYLLIPNALTYKKLDQNFYIISEQEKSGVEIRTVVPAQEVLQNNPAYKSANIEGLASISSARNGALYADITVKGKVTDALTKTVLPGASVMVKNTPNGTTTDVDGNFQLSNVKEGAVLVFSFIGYEPVEMAVNGRQKIEVALNPSNETLEQVLVVGYAEQKKSTLTGSVAQITSDQIKQAPPLNVSNVLAGRLPGVIVTQSYGRPGADDAAINVRGISTTGNNSPLVIVDGVERSFTTMDPNEIASVSVLKDAASAAVYGARAANGVILVTTKRGKSGKPVITYETNFSLNSNTRFPKFLNGPDYMSWYKKAEELDNEYLVSQGKTPFALTYSQEEIDRVRSGRDTSGFYGDTDWYGLMTDNRSMSQYHNLSVSGGSDRIRYFSTVGFWDQDGVMNNTNYKRYNVRANVDAKINEIVSTKLDLSVRMEDRLQPSLAPTDQNYQNPYVLASRMQPNLPMYGPGGMAVGANSDAGVGNPLVAVNDIGNRTAQTSTFNGNITFIVKIPWVTGLQAKVLAGYDKGFTESKTWVSPYTLAIRNRTATGWTWTTARMSAYSVNQLLQDYAGSNRITFQPSLTYDNAFDKHAISALLLYEYSGYKTNGFGVQARNFAIDDLKEINFGSKGVDDLRAASGSSSETKRAGYVGRLGYGYDEKYLVELAARYDGSVNFPTSKRWGFFPSASLGWVVSKESFWQGLGSGINFLKIRASAGKMGNDRINAFQYLNTFQLRPTPIVAIGNALTPSVYSNAPANLNITWEEANMYNIGLETNLFNSKLGIEIDYFYKLTKNILDTQSGVFAPSVGGNFPGTVNSQKVDNRGIDLQLNFNKKYEKFSYNIIGNFTYAHNRILKMNESINAPADQRRVGQSVGSKFGFMVDGLYQTQEEVNTGPSFPYGPGAPGYVKYRDLNGDGKISFEQDVTKIGKSNTPEIMYGLNLQAAYGIFDFSALLQGAARSNVILAGLYNTGVQSNTVYTQTFSGNGNSPYFLVEDAWRPDNPDAKFPRLTANKAGLTNQNGYMNSFFLRDGGYLRLKTLQVGVSLGKAFLSKIKVQGWRFYVAGSNLLTWDKIKYADPETPSVVQAGFYPQQRVMSVGTNITF